MESSTLFKVTVIIILFSILGLNIFSYLAKGTSFLGKITKRGGEEVIKGTKNIADKSVKGAQKAVDMTATAIHTGVDTVERAVNVQKNKENRVKSDSSTDSPIQKRNKGGYCYIGAWKGFRSCIRVGPDDGCLSGDIYPTHDICIHPNLRE